MELYSQSVNRNSFRFMNLTTNVHLECKQGKVYFTRYFTYMKVKIRMLCIRISRSSEREFAVCDILFKDMMYYVFHLIFVGIISRVRN